MAACGVGDVEGGGQGGGRGGGHGVGDGGGGGVGGGGQGGDGGVDDGDGVGVYCACATCGVCDVECAHCWRGVGCLAGDGLPVGVLDGRHVGVPEGAVDEPQHQARLPHAWQDKF